MNKKKFILFIIKEINLKIDNPKIIHSIFIYFISKI